MTSGRYRALFRCGGLRRAPRWPRRAVAAGVGAASAVALVALGGLLAHEHAYVQAGQSVPLA